MVPPVVPVAPVVLPGAAGVVGMVVDGMVDVPDVVVSVVLIGDDDMVLSVVDVLVLLVPPFLLFDFLDLPVVVVVEVALLSTGLVGEVDCMPFGSVCIVPLTVPLTEPVVWPVAPPVGDVPLVVWAVAAIGTISADAAMAVMKRMKLSCFSDR